ncbi:G patch domain-containing protein 3 [Astyanax mexicanus]|uniref:G patch domain-containing protein 3 n=1 Tax=Astyanax mexicanus TaxID=7994 RepID=UPI0020CB4222|nr:G patch domain-containing protein 3 [Astyanax mexicanus]
MAGSERDSEYYVVSNIPPGFRSADLRNYFSQFTESGGFRCFHYRHRPELRPSPAAPRALDPVTESLQGPGSDLTSAAENQLQINPQRSDQLQINPQRSDQLQITPQRSDQLQINPQRSDQLQITPQRSDQLQINPQRSDQLQINPQRSDQLQINPQRSDQLQITPQRSDQLQITPQRSDQLQITPQRSDQLQINPQRSDQLQINPQRSDQLQINPQRSDQLQITPQRSDPQSSDQPQINPQRSDQDQTDPQSSDQDQTDSQRSDRGQKAEGSCCCVVWVKAGEAERFIKMYAGNQWIDSKGNWLVKRCVLRRIKLSDHTDSDVFPYKTKAELKRRTTRSDHFTRADLKALPEMNPPPLMPQGNVGTPVSVFLQLIQSCRLPPRLIRQLGLTFPKTGSSRRYGNVPYQYHSSGGTVVPPIEESVFTAGGAEISGPGRVPPRTIVEPKKRPSRPPPIREQTPEAESEEDQSGPDDDDDRCEEWERHEALHEDVTSQERSKERLYEEEIELKWEKGGSGLVFYTDAQYWQEEEGDFDEQTADDWDVDMSVYYDKDGGDMDSRDYVRMRYETRRRDGLEETSSQQKIGTFEKFTKGVGRRVMEKQGWREGEGLGHAGAGIPEALENEGQHPNCKRGFGYHGEKLSSFQPLKKPRSDFLISTVYDQPKDMDRGDSLLRRQPNTAMKYRGWQPGTSTEPNS